MSDSVTDSEIDQWRKFYEDRPWVSEMLRIDPDAVHLPLPELEKRWKEHLARLAKDKP